MKKYIFIFWILILALSCATVSFATQDVRFQPENSSIEGSIKYTLIGNYNAAVDEYEGFIAIDEQGVNIESVKLAIKAASLRSRFPSLDRIVRSDRLLDVEKFPDITFNSKSISRFAEGYSVSGVLDFHGVKKEVTFPFESIIIQDAETGKKFLKARGTWRIQRRDFGVTWHKNLDKNGLIVGNYITVKWKIEAEIE